MMRNFVLTAIAATLVAASAGLSAAPPRISAAQQASLQQALSRGKLMYAYDQAAWHGTDDMITKIQEPEKKVGGWIVDGPAEAPELVFFDKDLVEPRAVYLAQFRGNQLVSSRVLGESDNRSLSVERRRMIAAQRAAVKAFASSRPQRCADRPFNTVILPPSAPGAPTLIYFLTPQTDKDAVPFGGHYLIEVSADGKVSPARAFTNSCLNMPFRATGVPAPAAIGVTHLLDKVPTEIHVFSSMVAGLPVMVMTAKNNRVWLVEQAGIQAVDPKQLK